MQRECSTNPSPTSRVLRQRPYNVTNAIASNGDANFEPGNGKTPPAKCEAQQLGFAVCSPASCPHSGRENKTQNMSTKTMQKHRRRIVTTTRTITCAEPNLRHKRTPSVADNALLHPFYEKPHARCSWPRQVALTAISCVLHAPRSEAVNVSLSLRITA